MDLIWGYTGLLSLGQGLYFGLGVYAVGYSLKLQQAWHVAGRELPYAPGPDMPLPNLTCGLLFGAGGGCNRAIWF